MGSSLDGLVRAGVKLRQTIEAEHAKAKKLWRTLKPGADSARYQYWAGFCDAMAFCGAEVRETVAHDDAVAEAALAQGSALPLCETTQTPRLPCALRCGTYAGNLGPCETWEEGANERCVYCDHGKQCHEAAQGSAPREYFATGYTREELQAMHPNVQLKLQNGEDVVVDAKFDHYGIGAQNEDTAYLFVGSERVVFPARFVRVAAQERLAGPAGERHDKPCSACGDGDTDMKYHSHGIAAARGEGSGREREIVLKTFADLLNEEDNGAEHTVEQMTDRMCAALAAHHGEPQK